MTPLPTGKPILPISPTQDETGAPIFYTYVWRDTSGLPFYVGKGKGKRAWHTYTRSKAFKEVWSEGGCSVEIVDYFIHESQAHANEMLLIQRYGRRDTGTGSLVNMTDGGDGSSGLCEEARRKISAANKGNQYAVGMIRSDETRARISASKQGQASRLGAILTEESRAKISSALRGRKLSLDHRARVSAYQNGRPKSGDHVAAVAESLHLIGARKDSSTGFKGVSKNRGRWVARITVNGIRRNISFHATPEEAALAYDKAAIEAWGRGNCYLNFPSEHEGKKA